MSWDLFVHGMAPSAHGAGDDPSGFEPRPLGLRADIIRRIQQVVPAADFSDPSWGTFEAPDFSVEFNMGDDGPIDCFALHVRGGDMAAGFVADPLARCGWRALDPASDSGMFDPATALASLRRWRAYRDHVIPGDTAG